MELRLRGDRPVLAEGDEAADRAPESVPLDAELSTALNEWARVAAAVSRAAKGESPNLGEPSEEAVAVVSRRGHQLAGRIASQMRQPVFYRDPVTEVTTVVVPAGDVTRPRRGRHAGGPFSEAAGEPTPWGTGLAVAGVFALMVFFGLLALVATLAAETSGWIALGATVIFSVGIMPSLWIGRKVPVVRWLCYGTAAGLVLTWVGLLFVLL